jgi:hypothetical protein
VGDRGTHALGVAARFAHQGLDPAARRRAAALRLAIEVKQWQLPPKWLRGVLAFVALLAVLLDYRTINGIDAGTALLVLMAGMKLLETRTVRDLTVIVFCPTSRCSRHSSTTRACCSCRTCS